MTTYDIRIIYKDKRIEMDKSGPFYGSYFKHSEAKKRAEEIELNEDVFMTEIITNYQMG